MIRNFITPEIFFDYIKEKQVTLRETKDNLAMSAEEFIDALSFRYSSDLDAETLAKAEKNYDVIMAAVDFLASRKG